MGQLGGQRRRCDTLIRRERPRRYDQNERVAAGLLDSADAPETDAGWQSLRTAEVLLRRHAREPVIANEKIADLCQQTQQLITNVMTTDDLGTETTSWLFDKLPEVRDALEDVELTGYRGVERAHDSAVGRAPETPRRRVRPKIGYRLGLRLGLEPSQDVR
jgi:hypothetical protein